MRSDATPSRDRPLQDRRVAVTRADDGAGGLAEMLRARGAVVLLRPLVRIGPPADARALDAAAGRIERYDWVVFTSANAVRALAAALGRPGTYRPGPRHVVAVGSGTAAAVHAHLGWAVTAVPGTFTGAAVVGAMRAVGEVKGQHVLWPRAAAARPVVARDIAAAGALLDAPEAYSTDADTAAAAALLADIGAGTLDAVTFTSPSAVHCFASQGSATGRACVAVIGPTTAAAARAAGMTVHVQPVEHTFSALVGALVDHFGRSDAGA